MNYARKQGITKKVIREKRLLWPRLARPQKSAEPKACKRDKGSESSLHTGWLVEPLTYCFCGGGGRQASAWAISQRHTRLTQV